jgi:glutathione S-transferase
MPLNPDATIEVTALGWVPEPAKGFVKDLRVRWALEEAGLDYRVRLIGPERPQGYLADQPFNQVPCFSDGTVRIFESGAIVQYIGEQSEALLPRDTAARYRAIQWTYSALSSVEPFTQHRVLLERVFAGQEWAELSKPTMDQFARQRLQQLSERLGDQTWLDGERFTIGDLVMVTVLRVVDRIGLLDPHPNLGAYLERGQARSAFRQALADHLADFERPQAQGEAA